MKHKFIALKTPRGEVIYRCKTCSLKTTNPALFLAFPCEPDRHSRRMITYFKQQITFFGPNQRLYFREYLNITPNETKTYRPEHEPTPEEPLEH